MPGVVEGQLDDVARRTFREWWGPSVDSWEVIQHYRIAHGQPRQTPPFGPKQSIRTRQGVYVCGDHRDTGSIQGALFSGRRCAEAVLSDIA
jgi:predicted NAD/FAD-dependent oxidoreductase